MVGARGLRKRFAGFGISVVSPAPLRRALREAAPIPVPKASIAACVNLANQADALFCNLRRLPAAHPDWISARGEVMR